MKPSDIPTETRDALKAAFKARGNTDPTDSDLLLAYWAGKFVPPQRAR